jgi:hypothetical protein
MLTSSYKQTHKLRFIAFIIAILLLALAAFKIYQSYVKVQDYSKAKASYAAEDYITAEQYYDKASHNGWLQYNDADTRQALINLKPVTEIKSQLNSMSEQINSAHKADDSKALLALHTSYQAMKKDAPVKGDSYSAVFQDMAAKLSMEQQLNEAFSSSIEQLDKALQAEIKKKAFTDDTVAAYLQIPAVYFGDEAARTTAVQGKLEAYDTARFDALMKESKLKDVLNEGIRLQKFYAQYGISAKWIVPKIEKYAQDQMSAAVQKNDLKSFIEYAKEYEATKELAVSGSKVLAFIQSTVNGQLAGAKQLVNERKYDKAIELYTQLGGYRNTAKQIQEVELAWSTSDPLHILQKAIPDQAFTSVINGKDQFGAMIYAAGITSGNLVLVSMQSDMSVDKKEAFIDKNLKSAVIKVTKTPQGVPLLVVEAASTSRKSRFIAFEVQPSGLKRWFDLEADGYEWEGSGVMIVDNAAGEGAGQKSFYERRNGEYTFAGIKPDYIDISLADLHKYKNVKVRFNCTVLAAEGGNAVVMYNGTYILLSGGPTLHPGDALVTGTWVSNEEVKKGTQSFSAYKINVASATQ